MPNTRARVEARRKALKGSATKAKRQTAQQLPERPPPHRVISHAYGSVSQVLPGPRFARTRRQVKMSLAAASAVLRNRNTGKRIQVQRSYAGSRVQPGLHQMVVYWLVTGRLFSLVIFLISAGALGYLFLSADFSVQQIRVEGNSILQGERVATLSGLYGRSIWFVNTDQAVEQLMQNPYVDHATIRVGLPNRAMISLRERRPEVRWQIGGVQYLIDGSGRVLDIAQEPAEPGTLVIRDTALQGLRPMEHVDPDALELARALALRLPTELNFTPATIEWDVGLGVYVTLSSGSIIVFGQTERLDQKLAILGQLLADGTSFAYLDLRSANPFYKQ